MKLGLEEFEIWNEDYRKNFYNSISGYQSVMLLGYYDQTDHPLLASCKSVFIADPISGQFGVILSASTSDTIKKSRFFTLNHVHKSFLKKAHFASIELSDDNKSNFETFDITLEKTHFQAPFIDESKLKIGLEFLKSMELSPGTNLVLGKITEVNIEEQILKDSGHIDLEAINDICIHGDYQYSSVQPLMKLSVPRAEDIPKFNKKERPDNVAFDQETHAYNANILPYGTNIGAPAIIPNDVSSWKNHSISSFNHSFNNKIEEVKKHYQNLVDEFQLNELIYSAKLNFEPVVGETYHLYTDGSGQNFLSMVPPGSWDKEFLGSFKLTHEKSWKKITE